MLLNKSYDFEATLDIHLTDRFTARNYDNSGEICIITLKIRCFYTFSSFVFLAVFYHFINHANIYICIFFIFSQPGNLNRAKSSQNHKEIQI